MPTKTVSNAGGNYNAGGTWVGGVVPLTTDDIAFTATSGNLNVNTAAFCAGVNFTNYVGTITFTNTLTTTGNINFGTGGYTVAGAGSLSITNGISITSNGTAWQGNLQTASSNLIITLVDALTVNGNYTNNTTGTITINGFTLTLKASYISSNSGTCLGTTNFIFNGTGSWSHTSTGILRNNVTINTAGTITFGTNVRYNTGTLTYTTGTVVTTGSTFTMDLSTTLNTNGTSITFNALVFNGTSAILTLNSDCYCNSFTMGANNKTINGSNLYNAGSLAAPGNSGNVQGSSTIIMNGTGTISSAGSSYIGLNVTINTVGTITLGSFSYGFGTFKYITGTTVNTGSTISLVQTPVTLDTNTMNLNNLTMSIFVNYTLSSALSVIGILRIVGGSTQTGPFGFTCGTLQMGTGQLTLPSGITNTITTNMNSLVSTLASRASIVCSTVAGTKAILNLSPGATQDNGYLSATDVDSSGGVTIWTYKGVLTREINWNQLSTDPRKHLFRFSGGTKIIKY